jgi:hypothetical protein
MMPGLKSTLFFSAVLSLLAVLGCSAGDDSLDFPEDSARVIARRGAIGDGEWKSENPTCQVRGNAANWQAAYCLWFNHTNDFEKDEVQDCYATLTEREGIPRTICDRNLYFKREICKTLALDKYFGGSVENCIQSDDSVPVVVREGL